MESIQEIKEKITPILQQYGITKAAIFGSLAKGEATTRSDVDILVEIKGDMSLLDFIGIKIELEEALKMKVDLVEYDTIKPII
ncbi:MAG: nucleotidyltransferase family protein, partial [Deltaproteobacteria bacterium]|nr:nucleotidyltransferase family protein [Deltaproteobacteria bacterium]